MMYRSGWGTKDGQEVTLAVWLRRAAFEAILREGVPSSFTPGIYASHDEWQMAVARLSVRIQWDPNHDPHGRPLARRAIQLGLRGEALSRYAGEWLLRIEDISPLVARQREIMRGESGSTADAARDSLSRYRCCPGPAAGYARRFCARLNMLDALRPQPKLRPR